MFHCYVNLPEGNWLEYSTTFRPCTLQPFRRNDLAPVRGSPRPTTYMSFFWPVSKHRNTLHGKSRKSQKWRVWILNMKWTQLQETQQPPEVSKCHGFAAKTELPSHHTNIPTRGNTVFFAPCFHTTGDSGKPSVPALPAHVPISSFMWYTMGRGAGWVGFCWCFTAFCQQKSEFVVEFFLFV